jgi:hypothetical protein
VNFAELRSHTRVLCRYLRLHGQFAEASLSLARFFKEGPTKVLEAKARAAGEPVAPFDPMLLAPPAIPLLHAPVPPAAAAAPPPQLSEEVLPNIDFGHNAPTANAAFTGFAFGTRASAPPRNPTSQLPRDQVPEVLTAEQRKAAELGARVAAYKKEVKGVLSAEAFAEFQSGLRRYKQHEIQVPELMSVLKPAFATAGAEKYEALMRGFVLFLPKKDKAIYEADIEGSFAAAAAGLRAKRDESGNKRRAYDLITGEASIASHKAPRLERSASFEMKPPPLLPPSPSAHNPLPHSIQSPPPLSRAVPSSSVVIPLPPPSVLAFVPPRPLSSSPRHDASAMGVTIPTTPPHSNTHVFSTPPPRNMTVRPTTPKVPSSPSTAPTPPSTSPPPAPVLTIPVSPAPATAGSPAQKTSLHGPESPAAADKDKEPPPRTAGKCPVCLDPPLEPCAARCGHVLCFACWEKQLAHKLECPVCKQKVRKSQVKRIYLG